MKCALIVRGFQNELNHQNFNDHLLTPLKCAFDVDIHISTLTQPTKSETEYLSPQSITKYDGTMSELEQLYDTLIGLSETYDYYVIHRTDVMYKYKLSFTYIQEDFIVSPYRHCKWPKNSDWRQRWPQWCDVYMAFDKNHLKTLTHMLHTQIELKPMHHLIFRSIFNLYLNENLEDKIYFLHQGTFNETENPFYYLT